MNCRNFVVTTSLLAALAIVPTACSKKSGGGASGASAGMLAMLPTDSQGVFSVSLSGAKSSDFYKKYEAQLTKNIPKEVQKIKADCGIDLLTDVSNVMVAANKDEKKMVFVVKGSFDQKKIEACVTKMGGKVDGGKYKMGGSEVINSYWPSSDTVVVSPGLTPEELKAIAGKSIKENKVLMALVGKVDSSATVWAIGEVPPEAAAMMGMVGGPPPKSAYLSLSLTDGVNATVGLVFGAEGDASALKTKLDGFMAMGKGQPGVKDLLEGVSLDSSGDTLTVKVKLGADQIEKLKGMAGGALPF